MNTADLLLANLERLLSSPTSAETIRKLIFDLAIRGQLTTQSDKDEPASVLIAKVIRTAQAEDRKFSAEPAVTERPFELPSGWEWVRLGNTGKIFNGTSASAGEKARLSKTLDGLPFIATKDVGYGRDPLCYENGLKVPHGDKDYKVAKSGAVLICAEGGSAGKKVGQTNRPICFGNKLYANETWAGIEAGYILSLYQSNFFYGEFKAKMTGIIGGIARSEFRSLRIPLPPLAEQKRIVAKVDELMALCDRLETQLKERDVKQAALANAALAKFTEDPTPENLQLLFHPSFSIEPEALRKSILTLAVQGKLCPQDLNEEPAEQLLARLMKRDTKETGRRKKTQPDLTFTPDEIPYELPQGWAWERLGNIGETNVGLTYSPQDISDVGIPVLRSSNVQNGKLDFDDLVRVTCEPKQSVMVKDRDLLICARNGSKALVGKVAVIEGLKEPAAFGAFMAIYRSEVNQYLYHFIRSPLFRKMIDEVNTTTINQITQNNLRSTLAPIPPYAEQLRIVEKVEQLMALVDTLEAQIEASRTTGEKLLEAMVAELTSA